MVVTSHQDREINVAVFTHFLAHFAIKIIDVVIYIARKCPRFYGHEMPVAYKIVPHPIGFCPSKGFEVQQWLELKVLNIRFELTRSYWRTFHNKRMRGQNRTNPGVSHRNCRPLCLRGSMHLAI